MGFLMIPLTTLCSDYIDRPKLSEQKKKPSCVYSPSPTKVGRNNNAVFYGTATIPEKSDLAWKNGTSYRLLLNVE